MSYQCLSKNRRIYYKTNAAKAINNLEKIILDFDGVLVYTSKSYFQTVIKVIDYFFHDILGLEGEKGKLITLKEIQDFKDTGLYNNDWSLVNAVINYYLTIIMSKLQKDVIQEFIKNFDNIQFTEIQSLLPILKTVGDFFRSYGVNINEMVDTKYDATFGLSSFLVEAKKSQNPLDVPFMPSIQDKTREIVKRLIPYNVRKQDFLRRLFEEAYLGKELFNKFWNTQSVFGFKDSFLEKETFIPSNETLNLLQLRFGRLLIYSEKARIQGMYLLENNKLKKYFNEDKSVFFDEIVELEKNSGGEISYAKPNPICFIKVLEEFGDKIVAYIGDSVADALLIKNARSKGFSNVLFFGVLCSTQYPDNLFSEFIKYDADAIMTDVDDISYLIDRLRRKDLR